MNIVILAAGQGKRMHSNLPKVLHLLCGRPMVCRVLDALEAVGIAKPIIIVGRGAELVERTLGRGYAYVLQEQQLGSGHAVMCAREAVEGIIASQATRQQRHAIADAVVQNGSNITLERLRAQVQALARHFHLIIGPKGNAA